MVYLFFSLYFIHVSSVFFHSLLILSFEGLVTEEQYRRGTVYPPLSSIRQVSLDIATAIAEHCFNKGLASVPRPKDIPSFLSAQMYDPKYSVTSPKL